MSNNNEEYAFGDWSIDGTSCPIESAGLDDKPYADAIATDFDDKAIALLPVDDRQGTITEQQAKKVFEKLVEMYDRRLDSSRGHSNTNQSKLNVAKEVLKEEIKK